MKYLLYEYLVETVITVEGSSTQGLIVACIPKQVVSQKQDLAKRIDTEMHSLQEKHQSRFLSGKIYPRAPGSINNWKAYYDDYQRRVEPLLQKYHQLTPEGAKRERVIISDSKRRYQIFLFFLFFSKLFFLQFFNSFSYCINISFQFMKTVFNDFPVAFRKIFFLPYFLIMNIRSGSSFKPHFRMFPFLCCGFKNKAHRKTNV
ncbi:hypothetical protein HYX13_04810 [Candidatus Woesearchaeota archaeon]|nr:hypothetical protein [Candidatus Woesearchaeota archaeon]